MIKLYITIFILAIVGAISSAGYFYYTSTQKTIATLRANNVKLEMALSTARDSLETMQAAVEKTNELNLKLQQDLQAAEAYTDELRSKFSRLDLVQDALRDSKKLEGKMNGATAKLWRNLMESTGSSESRPLPQWLQQSVDAGQTGGSGDEAPADPNTDGSKTEANPAE